MSVAPGDASLKIESGAVRELGERMQETAASMKNINESIDRLMLSSTSAPPLVRAVIIPALRALVAALQGESSKNAALMSESGSRLVALAANSEITDDDVRQVLNGATGDDGSATPPETATTPPQQAERDAAFQALNAQRASSEDLEDKIEKLARTARSRLVERGYDLTFALNRETPPDESLRDRAGALEDRLDGHRHAIENAFNNAGGMDTAALQQVVKDGDELRAATAKLETDIDSAQLIISSGLISRSRSS